MGFGGSVWHASVCGDREMGELRDLAESALDGVGDPLWEWWHSGSARGRPVAHLRRRTSPGEAKRIGAVRDIRGTMEFIRRVNLMVRATGFPATRLLELESGVRP